MENGDHTPISVPQGTTSVETSEQTQGGGADCSSDMCSDVRIVLLGKPGEAKSVLGDTILGENVFKTRQDCPLAETSRCSTDRAVHSEVGGRGVYVIDTPGLFATNHSKSEILTEIAKCTSLSSPGPHAFLVPIQLGRFTQEEQETVKMIQKTFGERSAKYTMVLFSHGDRLGEQTIEEFISDNDELKTFIDQCCGRYHVFNNEDPDNRSQVSELLQKIDEMLAADGGGHYSSEMFQQAEEETEQEKERTLSETEAGRNVSVKGLKGEPKKKRLRGTFENLDKTGKKNSQKKCGFTDSFAFQYRLQSAGTGAVYGAVTCSLLGVLGGPVGIVAGLVIGAAGGAGLGAGAGPGVRAAADNCSIQ